MLFRCCVCWVIVVYLFLNLIAGAESLSAGGKGVCVVKQSIRKTRHKYVPINKWCGKKKCVVKKIEKYSVPENRVICCNGWGYDVTDDICNPICSTGCTGGRCAGPELCACDPPTALDPDHNNVCVKPSCDPPCVNANCIAQNTCKCHAEFNTYNSTHCYKCDNGYEVNEDFNCMPICRDKCVNAKCTSPDTCTCVENYKKSDRSHVCEPICDSCVNSTCVAPNVCSCLEGYGKVSEMACAPKCDSCDGECVAPNVCRCREGYAETDGVCRPVCGQPCVNGHCSAPEECSCDAGFQKSASADACEEIMADYDEKKLVYKKPYHHHCQKNDTACTPEDEKVSHQYYLKEERTVVFVAQCGLVDATYRITSRYAGFLTAFSSSESQELLEFDPTTHRCCVKLKCIVGFSMNAEGVCEPSCSPPCGGIGVCVAPNECRLPPCAPSCGAHAYCASATCHCDADYEPLNATHCQPSCKAGYKRDVTTSQCQPLCDRCDHGKCIGPNECQCYDRYTKINEICTPECSNCKNGECRAPGECQCHPGYSRNNNICEPVCENKCINGKCEKPNICTCFSGYNMSENNYICDPVCGACDNGVCVEPGVCKCNDNFEILNGSCKQIECASCEGQCSRADDCACADGRRCFLETLEEVSVMLASVPPVSWIVGGTLIMVLFAVSIIVIFRLYIKRKSIEANDTQVQGSVMYTLPEASVRAPAGQESHANTHQKLLVYHDQSSDDIV